MVAAYHASARAELIARLDKRDSSMFLFIGAVAALSALFLSNYPSAALTLLIVPLLGLGSGLVHAQHNAVIGGLSVYLGKELQVAAAEHTGVTGLRSWDASVTFRDLRGFVGTRFASSLVIFVGPSVIAVVLVSVSVSARPTVPTVGLTLLAAAATVWTCVLLVRAHRLRALFTAEIATAFPAE